MKKKDVDKERRSLRLWQEALPPALNSEETLALIKEYRKYGDTKIRDKIVYGNLRLVAYALNKIAHRIINKETVIYPSFEDVAQDGALITIKAIEKFNLDYNFAFSTYLVHNLESYVSHKVRALKADKRKGKVVSLNAPVKNSHKGNDESGTEFGDLIESEAFTEDIMNDKMELEFIKKEILPILSKQERDIFEDYYFNDMTQDKLAEKYGYSQPHMGRIIDKVRDEVNTMYLNGITDIDRLFRGVSIGTNRNAVLKNYKILKIYGKDFLEQYFMPTLGRVQRNIFDKMVLHYYGQSRDQVAKELGMSQQWVTNNLVHLYRKIEEDLPKLKEMQRKGQIPKTRQLPRATIQEINRNERLIEQYGGRLFLYHYFLPTLPETERKIFENAVLNYNGENKSELAKKSGVLRSNFVTKLPEIIEKLKNTNFEIVVDTIDNSRRADATISNFNLLKQERAKQRLELVEKFGGKTRLQRLFAPILPESQKRVLEDMYLSPKFDSLESLAKHYGIGVAPVAMAEKTMLAKLESLDLNELARLQKKAQQEYALSVEESIRKSLAPSRQKRINKLGGKEFLLEVFTPTLQIKSHRIILEDYILGNKSKREVLEKLGLPKRAGEYLSKTQNNIMTRMRIFVSQQENFEQIVKDFYAKKAFEKEHPEDFEKIALGVKEEEEKVAEDISIKDLGKFKIDEKRKAFFDEYMSKFGDKKELIRKFMPSLKKVTTQQVFLGTFLEYKPDIQVAEEYGLSLSDIRAEKRYILGELESFAKQKESSNQQNLKKRAKTKQ